jgi:hypothetical protein
MNTEGKGTTISGRVLSFPVSLSRANDILMK